VVERKQKEIPMTTNAWVPEKVGLVMWSMGWNQMPVVGKEEKNGLKICRDANVFGLTRIFPVDSYDA
jgi:hypothetical protein